MKNAKLFHLKLSDGIKGFVIAVLTTITTGLMAIINSGELPTVTEWKGIAMAAIGAALAYILKNFFTNSEDKMLTGEPPKPETVNPDTRPVPDERL